MSRRPNTPILWDELTPLAITSIQPAGGLQAGGEVVDIYGRGFELGMTAKIDGVLCTGLVVQSANQLTCTTPAGAAGAQDVRLDRITTAANATLAGGYTYIYDPLDIPNLALYYEAGLGTTTSGGLVTALANQGSLAGADLAQGTVANQPTYTAADAGYNNKPTMTFADATDVLENAGPFGPFSSNVATIFFVGDIGEATAGHIAMNLNASASGRDVRFGLDAGGWPTLYTDGGVAIIISQLTTKNIAVLILNGAASRVMLNTRANVGADGNTTTTMPSDTDLRIKLGQNISGLGAWGAIAPGKLAAVGWVARVMTNGEIDDLFTYYKAKYSIP